MTGVSAAPLRPAATQWYARPSARNWTCSAPPATAFDFHTALPGYLPTPLWELPALASELGVGRLMVKDESSRLGLPAFKALGVWWAAAHVVADRAGLTRPLTLDALCAATSRLSLTLVTATAGNHGRALARVAAQLGLRAHIFVPENTSPAAAMAIASEGATVTTVAGSYREAVEQAGRACAARPDAELVQDTAWPGYEAVPARIVEGYATLLHEVDAQLLDTGCRPPGLVVVPVGVGSLAQAVVGHYRSRKAKPPPAILGVEPAAAPCILESLTARELRTVPTGSTNMVGLNCGTPSSLAWPSLCAGLDAATTVHDQAATRAAADLERLGVSSGPSGAAALAGVRCALTGRGNAHRRSQLDVGSDSVVVLLSTEGSAAVGNDLAA